MNEKWKYFIIGYLWSLPHTLVGLLLVKLIYRAHSFRWSSGCIECVGGVFPDGRTRIWGQPSAQTHGFLIIYSTPRQRERASLRVHERCHVVQGFIGGPLFVLAYGLCFLWFFARQGFKDWHAAYMKNPFEIQAYAKQSLLDDGHWG